MTDVHSFDDTDIFVSMSMAGSTGKSTTFVTMAVKLGALGFTVWVFESDPQCNASTWLGYPQWDGPSMADLWTADEISSPPKKLQEVLLPARRAVSWDDDGVANGHVGIPNVSIIPGNPISLERVMNSIVGAEGSERFMCEALEKALEDGMEMPDIILADAPGQSSPIHDAAMLLTTLKGSGRKGSRGIVTATKAAAKEIEGLDRLGAKIRKFKRKYREHIELLTIVPCQVPSQAGAAEFRNKYRFPVAGGYAEMLQDIENGFDSVLVGGVTPPIRQSTVVDEAYGAFCPLPFYDSNPRAKVLTADIDESLAYLQKRGVMIGSRADLVPAS